MKRMLTGIKPSGDITLGNYIGAIKQMVENQSKYESFIFVADLHTITVPQDKESISKNIKNLLALYLACGIDPKQNTIFLQSENLYHTNLSWLLECNTYYGELSRMHQFKEKTKNKENFSAGLLTYPVLMAADIFLYDTNYVPVGIDQKQHVEIARDIAIRFNKKFGDTFVVPEPLIKESGTKIMDLQDPSKKMSKSEDSPKGVIKLLDDKSIIRKKIMSATTDSDTLVKYDQENKPGISNLMNIYSSLTNKNMKDIELEFEGCNYGEFKSKVADTVEEVISKIQENYNKIINSNILDDILNEGNKKTSALAKEKYELAKNNMGIHR